jgi:hypothetical protein
VEDKFQRVAIYHRRTMGAMADLIGAAGLHSPLEVDLHHISRRFNGKIRTLDELFAGTSELSSHEERERHGRTQGEPRAPTPPR